MMADVSGRPLLVPQVSEPAAAAGAQLVLWGWGESKILPPPPMVRYEPVPTRVAAYEPVYHTYLEVFETMQNVFAG
jgi:sugar (pentulose or hexulose) kinase